MRVASELKEMRYGGGLRNMFLNIEVRSNYIKMPLLSPLKLTKNLFRQLCFMLVELRECGYQHMDLHEDNILCGRKGGLVDGEFELILYNFKITPVDFGLLCKIGQKPKIVNKDLCSNKLKQTKVCCRNCDVKALFIIAQNHNYIPRVHPKMLEDCECTIEGLMILLRLFDFEETLYKD
jgi:hypothetical protein